MKKIWITWENQRRNRELSNSISIRLFQFAELDDIKNPFRKYPLGIAKTLRVLWKEDPDLVFCQNPSLVLALVLCLEKCISGRKICVDAHNAGLFPMEGRSKVLSFLSRFVQRQADLTITSNNSLQSFVRENGGRALVLPDRIPDIPNTAKRTLKGKYNVLFICSYAEDEPYHVVFDAARRLDKEIYIYVTGNYAKRNIDPTLMPNNVILTGFIPEKEYIEMLNSVDATIDLTTREDCLVCGAYESVAAEKPMILSRTNALMRYFSRGAVYVDHNVPDLQRAIREVLQRRERLSIEVIQLKQERHRQWIEMKKRLEQTINRWS